MCGIPFASKSWLRRGQPPLASHFSNNMASAKPKSDIYKKKEICKKRSSVKKHPGCKGDPRMNRAVESKLLDPNLTTFQALVVGGYQYESDGDPDALDPENVSLRQRKNQLSRRFRCAKLAQEQQLATRIQLIQRDLSAFPVNTLAIKNIPQGFQPFRQANENHDCDLSTNIENSMVLEPCIMTASLGNDTNKTGKLHGPSSKLHSIDDSDTAGEFTPHSLSNDKTKKSYLPPPFPMSGASMKRVESDLSLFSLNGIDFDGIGDDLNTLSMESFPEVDINKSLSQGQANDASGNIIPLHEENRKQPGNTCQLSCSSSAVTLFEGCDYGECGCNREECDCASTCHEDVIGDDLNTLSMESFPEVDINKTLSQGQPNNVCVHIIPLHTENRKQPANTCQLQCSGSTVTLFEEYDYGECGCDREECDGASTCHDDGTIGIWF